MIRGGSAKSGGEIAVIYVKFVRNNPQGLIAIRQPLGLRGTYRIHIDTNCYDGIMSADASGITTCLFACSHLSFNDPKGELFAERFHQLRDYALGHPESGEIFSAID